jgi:hypothetical protein
MKRIICMKSKSLANAFAVILLGAALLAPAAGPDSSDGIVKTVGSVSYVSGGIGLESRERLASLTRDFNLKLVFASTSGEYVSGVRVAIANAAGKTLLDATSEGPWLLARLPAGNYQIVATFGGNAVKRQTVVGAANLATIDFRWASE